MAMTQGEWEAARAVGPTPAGMTLVLRNAQGASEIYRAVADREEARELIGEWADPENLTASLTDEETVVYEGPAGDL